MKKYQIIRMKSGKQQHYDRGLEMFKNSVDRWSGVFEAAPEEARELFGRVRGNARKTQFCSLPKLSEVI